MKRATLPALAVSLSLVAQAGGFETATSFQASKILAPEFVKGPYHTVAEAVPAEDYYLRFHIVSNYGDFDAEGRTMLRVRLSEVDALARLDEVSKTEVFVKAAGGAFLNIGKGVVSAVKDPEATVKGIGSGIKRLGVNLGRVSKRAVQSATADKKEEEAEPKSTAARTGAAAGGAALSILGVNGAARRWAQKLGVDPYTTNAVLHDALVSIGKIDAAGGISAKIVVPLPMIVSTTATVGGLVWGKDPEEVRKINEQRLSEIGVSKDDAGRFFANPNFTLTSQTRFVAALHAVKVKGSVDYVAVASGAEDERDALFFVESVELLQGLDATRPVSEILVDSRAVVARTEKGAVVLLPFDYLRWTEWLAESSRDIAARARREMDARALEVHLSGTATEAAKAGLAASGYRVVEGAVDGLLFKPAD